MSKLLEEKDQLRDTIRALLYCRDDALFAVELQKIIFYADVYATEKYRGRLTQAIFKPMMYGAYSNDIKNAIEHIKSDNALIQKSGMRKGRTRKKYIYLDVPKDIPSGKFQFIENIARETEEYRLEQLTTLSKENWLYRNSTNDDKMSFSDYRDALESENADPIIGVFELDAKKPDWLYSLK